MSAPLTLRPYQERALSDLWNWFGENTGNPLVVLPTGAGKSLVIAEWCKLVFETDPTACILVVTHVRELVQQNALELVGLWPEAPWGIYSAGLGRRDIAAPLLFASIQSIHKKAYSLPRRVDMVIVDECFVAGTQVTMADGTEKAIEQVKPGEYVSTALGSAQVYATSKRPAKTLMRLELENGEIIRCTENHPIFTTQGFVEAGKLEVGTYLFREEDVRALRDRVSPVDEAGRVRKADFGNEAGALEKAKVLFDLLLEEAREPDGGPGCSGEDDGLAQADRASTERALGQRVRVNAIAREGAGNLGQRLDCGASGTQRIATAERAPNRLQNRCGQSLDEDRNRIGRRKSHREAQSRGRAEGRPFGGIRLAHISREEPAGGEPVFNLQVAGHPSYFANGVLAHNCHLIPRTSDTMYGRFLADLKTINPALKIIGLTATPFRLDSGRLDQGEGAMFDGIAHETPVRGLIEDGYLCPPVSRSRQTADVQISTAGVGTRGGEFIAAQLEANALDPDVVDAIADRIVAAGQDRRSWLVFGCTVKHCEALAEALNARGYPGRGVFGDTDQAEGKGTRDRTIAAFKAGELRFLVSQGVLTTGFNARSVDLIALARPTKSTGMYIQMVGRGTRLSPETHKADCLILDFGGNIARHGPFDDPFIPDKKGKGEGMAPFKVCPECETDCGTMTRICPCCGFEFPPPERVVDTRPADKPILSVEPEWLDVSEAAYKVHTKPGSPNSLRVEYRVGLTFHREWVCLEHSGYARTKAESWWLRRAPAPVPRTVEEAIARAHEIAVPSHVRVKRNGKYDEIIAFRFEPRAPEGLAA